MRCVILSGGNIADYQYIKGFIREGDIIVCADSGYKHAVAMEIAPTVVVGDMDSIGEIPQGVPVVKYPPEKDYTDTEIAIEWGIGQGADEFMLLGATGTRLDHGLGNILLLKGLYQKGIKARVIDEHNKISYSDSAVTIEEEPGTLVSMIALRDCSGIYNKGLGYPLSNASLRMDSSLGISNYVVSTPAGISIEDGEFLLIIARD